MRRTICGSLIGLVSKSKYHDASAPIALLQDLHIPRKSYAYHHALEVIQIDNSLRSNLPRRSLLLYAATYSSSPASFELFRQVDGY